MPQNARRKLEEAKYFLTQMEETKGGNVFFYNLSAFFSAARSVTFFLQKEYNHLPEFQDWYSKEQERMGDNPLFDLMRDARNFVLKESYPEARSVQVSFSCSNSSVEQVIFHGDIRREEELLRNQEDGDMKYYLNMHKVSGIDWNSSLARRPISDICEDAVRELEDLINRCEETLAAIEEE